MTTILGIETSCDDTSAAIVRDCVLLSNVIASQQVHEAYGGVVPELASRAHQQNIVPVVDRTLHEAGLTRADIDAVAFTRGPGLPGSLHVGTAFAKGLALALGVPLVDVNHLHGHVLAHFIRRHPDDPVPDFPFLCLLVSGGNSQIIRVDSPRRMEILGKTIDDAAGEAFDKCAKAMGLPYPGGPVIDRLAASGDPKRFRFAKPHIPGLDYSFSGLKTSFLYTLRDGLRVDPLFIENNRADLAAALQQTIVAILMDKFEKAIRQTGIRTIAIGGGVSANSAVRAAVEEIARRRHLTAFIPPPLFTTDNAAMIAVAGHFKYEAGEYCDIAEPPFARLII